MLTMGFEVFRGVRGLMLRDFQDRHVRPLRGVRWDPEGCAYSLVILSSPPIYGRSTGGISTEPSDC